MSNVKITKVPQMGSVENEKRLQGSNSLEKSYGNAPSIKIKRTLAPAPREEATLEAQKGETVVTNLQNEGLPEFYKIGGNPHSRGGTPLNLPEDSFIFSKEKKFKIKDEDILNMFGKTGKKNIKRGATPAEISLQYDLNKYREILMDPSIDAFERETAEMMMKNYTLKLSNLALTQESVKGFDRGLPQIAMPYMHEMGINPEDILGETGQSEQALPQFADGGSNIPTRRVRIVSPKYVDGGATRKVRISATPALPQYTDAGETDPRKGKVQKLPAGARGWDKDAANYDESKVKKGHYIKGDDGYWHVVTGRGVKKYEGELDDDVNLGKWSEGYSLLRDKFQDKDIQKAFAEKARVELRNTKPSKRLSQKDIDAAIGMTDAQLVDNYLRKQRVNLAIQEKHGDLSTYDAKDLWDSNPDLANETAAELGYDPFSIAETAAFQAGYIGFDNLTNDPEYKDKLKDFHQMQVGLDDDFGGSTGKKTISGIDGWDGNTTSGQVTLPTENELLSEEVEWVDGPKSAADIKHLNPEGLMNEKKPFWTQDAVNLWGAVADRARLKKHDPWQKPLNFNEATPAFQDFRGAAARINSGGKAMGALAGNVAGPQALAALQNKIQANQVKGILGVQELEQKNNIATANKFELFNTTQKNAFDKADAKWQTKGYDKQIFANQAFETSKQQARQNMRNMFNTAWTNRGKTQTMNAMYPDFSVDPITGYTHKTAYNPGLDEGRNPQSTMISEIAELKEAFPGENLDTIAKLYKIQHGLPVTDKSDALYPAPKGTAGRYQYPSKV